MPVRIHAEQKPDAATFARASEPQRLAYEKWKGTSRCCGFSNRATTLPWSAATSP